MNAYLYKKKISLCYNNFIQFRGELVTNGYKYIKYRRLCGDGAFQQYRDRIETFLYLSRIRFLNILRYFVNIFPQRLECV